MFDTNNYKPELQEKTVQAIQKIQDLGYTFTFNIPTKTYQACLENPDGTFEAIHTFKDWHEIIKWTEENTP